MAAKTQTQTLNRKPRRKRPGVHSKTKQTSSTKMYNPSPKRKRPGVHSKKKTSKSKRSKNYKKAYRGQGK